MVMRLKKEMMWNIGRHWRTADVLGNIEMWELAYFIILRFAATPARPITARTMLNGSGTLGFVGSLVPSVMLSKAIAFALPPKSADIAVPLNDTPIGTNGL